MTAVQLKYIFEVNFDNRHIFVYIFLFWELIFEGYQEYYSMLHHHYVRSSIPH